METGFENYPVEIVYIKEEVKDESQAEDVDDDPLDRPLQGNRLTSSVKQDDSCKEEVLSIDEERVSESHLDTTSKVVELKREKKRSAVNVCDICEKKVKGNREKFLVVSQDGNQFKVCISCYQLCNFPNASLHKTNEDSDSMKALASPDKTTKHEKTSKHRKNSSFVCGVCSKSFLQRGDLNKHSVVHTKERRYMCEVCNMRFTQKGNMRVHMRLHTGEHPFSCDLCDRTFTRKNNLEVHTRVHTGERLYPCHMCKRAFNLKSDLVRHYRVHTGERPYSCSICKKAFTRKSHLKVHQRRSHRQETT